MRPRARLARGAQDPGRIRQQRERDLLPRPPVGGHLQDRGPRQAAMGDERGLGEGNAAHPRHHRKGYARDRAKIGRIGPERQRHERGPRRDDAQPEAARDVIGNPARPHLGNGRPARRDHQPARPSARDVEPAVGVADLADGCAQPDLNPSAGTFGHEHRHDLARRAVAEELPERLFVPGDAVARDQPEEIGRGIARQRRFREMGVLGEKAAGPRAGVGEVAPPPARDQDLLARLLGMVEDQHPRAPLSGRRRRHQARAARPEHDGVEGLSPRLRHAAGSSAPRTRATRRSAPRRKAR